jgi:hypothetical protein
MKKLMYKINVEDLPLHKYPFSKNKFRVKKKIHAFALQEIRFQDWIENQIKSKT